MRTRSPLICRQTPKCRPEIAGLGIECCWAVAKALFRNENVFLRRTLSRRVDDALNVRSQSHLGSSGSVRGVQGVIYMLYARLSRAGEGVGSYRNRKSKSRQRSKRGTGMCPILAASGSWIRSLLALNQPSLKLCCLYCV
jgi:hypothetical protein